MGIRKSFLFLWILFGLIFLCVIAYFIFFLNTPKNTVFLSGNMQVKISKMVRGPEAEKLVLSLSSQNLAPGPLEEYLILKIVVRNKSPKVVYVPYSFNLLLENQNADSKECRVAFRDDIEMPNEGEWKKLDRLERIEPYQRKEGALCFLIPKDSILKRFYVYQSFLTFP